MPRRWFTLAFAIGVGLSITVAAREQLSPATVAKQLQLADVLFGECEYRGAMGVYLRATDTTDAALRNRARRGVIRGALRIGEFGVAAAQAAALKYARPGDSQSTTLIGDSLWASGLFDEAESAYREALALDPAYPRARSGLARSLASRSRLDEAMVEASAAVAAEPMEAEFRHTVATINERLHDYAAAADNFTRYLELLPYRDRLDRARWTMAQVQFLRAFRGRVPYQIDSSVGQIHSIPFRLVKDKVVIRGRANGRNIDLTLDTGAEQSVLSVGAARDLGVRTISTTRSAGVGLLGIRGFETGVLDSLQIGTLKVRNLPIMIKNPPYPGLGVDQIESFSPLGLGLSVRVDYENRSLVMASSLPPEPADFELPLRLHRLATVRGQVNDRPASFIVDTGGEVISLNLSTANALFRPALRSRIAVRVFGTSGWDPDAYLLPGVNLAFDEIEYRNTHVVVLNLRVPSVLLGYDIGGTVGHKFLSRYRVDMDLRDSVIRLKQIDGKSPRPGD